MTLNIISSHSILYTGEVDSATFPGVKGRFTVLKNHAPIISVLTGGKIECRLTDGSDKEIDIKGGLVDVADNKLNVCVY
ncbi:MAG: F0F1 ATP synthase subunit epsilon [Muribaculaceae bacterium]|nr:F0F1 ATP synthase subunit epsilon [Muribaculaceae bacterium]